MDLDHTEDEKVARLLELAERLGRGIAESDRYQRLKEINDQIEADPETKRLLVDYQLVTSRLDEKERTREEPSSQETRLKAALERRIRGNPQVLEMLRLQADLAELMAKIRSTLEKAIGSEVKTDL